MQRLNTFSRFSAILYLGHLLWPFVRFIAQQVFSKKGLAEKKKKMLPMVDLFQKGANDLERFDYLESLFIPVKALLVIKLSCNWTCMQAQSRLQTFVC